MGISPERVYRFEKKLGAFFAQRRGEVKVKAVETPSIPEGIRLGEEGSWGEALIHFVGVYKDEKRNFSERIVGGIWASQILINMGRLNQAEGILDSSEKFFQRIGTEERRLLSARILEKRAWIADYHSDYAKEVIFLSEAKEIYDSLGENLDSDYVDSRSTVEHFLGRARFGLARQGSEKSGNLNEAIVHFSQDLGRYEDLRVLGLARPKGEMFNCLWLARCFSHSGNFAIANEFLGRAKRNALEVSEKSGDNGVLAHYYLTLAETRILEGDVVDAVKSAEEALEIRLTSRPFFPKGAVEAFLVLGLAYYQEGKIANSFVFIQKGTRLVKRFWKKQSP